MIAVWAPRAQRMRVRRLGAGGETLDEHKLDGPHERAGDGGWWSADIALADGDRYGFLIDDADQVRPDPRSKRQPDGVHGPSAAFDPQRFAWTDGAWTGRQLAGAVIYELHIGTFTPDGTLDSAVAARPPR